MVYDAYVTNLLPMWGNDLISLCHIQGLFLLELIMRKEILNKFINRFDSLYKEPLAVPVKNKDTACIKCNYVISDNEPFISVMGDTYCVPCHSVIHDKEVLREREFEYYKPNICVRCHTKITGGFYSDCKPDGTKPGGNICSPCVEIEDSKIIDVVANVVKEVN